VTTGGQTGSFSKELGLEGEKEKFKKKRNQL